MNTLEKEFIPYEQALALKELGFDEPCFRVYDTLGFVQDEKIMDELSLEKIQSPTFSQAFKFFREKYNLKSWVEEYTKNKYIYEIRPHKITDYKEGEIYVYATYEEAELACLKKLIEIIKTKQNG